MTALSDLGLTPAVVGGSNDTWGTETNAVLEGIASETITKTVNQNFADKVLSRPILKDYGEDLQTLTITAGAATWNFESANHAKITLTANTTLTISNPTATGDFCGGILFVTQDGTGSRTLTFPASVQSAPTVTTTAGKTDVYLLWTIDGGTKYFVQTMQTSITL